MQLRRPLVSFQIRLSREVLVTTVDLAGPYRRHDWFLPGRPLLQR